MSFVEGTIMALHHESAFPCGPNPDQLKLLPPPRKLTKSVEKVAEQPHGAVYLVVRITNPATCIIEGVERLDRAYIEKCGGAQKVIDDLLKRRSEQWAQGKILSAECQFVRCS